MKVGEFSLPMGTVIALVFVAACFPLYGEVAPSTNLGAGQPGLKIDYRGTNRFVIYLDEPWTVGPGSIGGYYDRHIDVLFEQNYGLKRMLQTREWDGGDPQQLYPFDDQRIFTCETAKLGLDHKTFTHWPHQTQLFSINGNSLSVSDDVYVLARQQYGLTTNQFFLGKIGTNIFYWEMGDPRKAIYRAVGDKSTVKYFELPKGMIDLFGVTKSVKKDVGFTVLRKSSGFFQYSPNTFDFIEVSFNTAKPVKNDTDTSTGPPIAPAASKGAG
ncbi:MAG TPA: hypothetical protein VGO57_17490 [Verrucomicrobiae bacterium]|jgi:hypothetical protein